MTTTDHRYLTLSDVSELTGEDGRTFLLTRIDPARNNKGGGERSTHNGAVEAPGWREAVTDGSWFVAHDVYCSSMLLIDLAANG